MDLSANLLLPYLAAAQSQKHVTVNEALRILDAVVQLSVIDRVRQEVPGSPAEGNRYLVANGATGLWAGHDDEIAVYQDGAWAFLVPRTGWLVWIADEAGLIAWDGSHWAPVGGGVVNPAALVGVNATADATNRLSVKSDATLFSHDDVTPGSGDMRQKLNKAAAGNTVSQLYQTSYSGRAEVGLTGDDDFHVKVSPDGAVWREALLVDRTDGRTAVQGLKSIRAGYAAASSTIFTPGGDGVVSIYRINGTSGQHPRTATISTISGDVITLTSAVGDTIFSSQMTNVSLVRIWNTTLSADAHSAWVAAYISSTQLRVHNAASIAGWSPGQIIQVGDPLSATAGRCITLDISPMLTHLFGAPFRQTGIVVRASLIAATQGDKLGITPTGATGSNVNGAVCCTTGAQAGDGVTIIPCTDLSPVSNSNLVRVQETIATTAGTRLFSSMAVLV